MHSCWCLLPVCRVPKVLSYVGAGRPQTRRPSSAKRRLRLVECRARFFQLRLKELAGQEEHYKAELERLREQQQLAADISQQAVHSAGSAGAPAQKQQEPAAVVAPTSVPQPELKQEPAGEEGILSSALPPPRQQSAGAAGQALLKPSASLGEQALGLRRSQRRRKHERLHAPDLVPATLLRHPMFAAVAGVSNPSKVITRWSVGTYSAGCLFMLSPLLGVCITHHARVGGHSSVILTGGHTHFPIVLA